MNNSLVGYAVLRANYNANAGSYLDNFIGFVLDSLASAHPRYLQKEQIAEAIRRDFGIAIPDLVVGRLLRRTRKLGLASEVARDCFAISEEGLANAPAIRDLATRYRAEQAELEAHFREFVTTNYPDHESMLDQNVGTALHAYFERHAVPLLTRSIKGSPLTVANGAGFDYLISRFVAHLAEYDQARFNYAVDASKGAILASVLDLDTSGFSESLGSLSLYFDAPVVINALGFQGEVFERAARQTLELARAQGARLCVFEHSVREVRGILDGAEHSLRAGARSTSTSAVYLHLMESGQSAADVQELQNSLETRLKDLGLRVVEKPGAYVKFGLDEVELEQRLQDAVHYREASTRLYDVDSLSAVYMLREGTRSDNFERSKAVFITSNSALVRASREYTEAKASFPLAIHEMAASALLWVRSSAMEDDVPREQLLATAYAGMQPNPNLWSRYIEEIDKLEARQAVTADEAVILRSTSVGRSALMDETLGSGDELSDDLPLHVLERLRSDLEAPLRATIDDLHVQKESFAVGAATADEQVRSLEDKQRDMEQRLVRAEQEAKARQLEADALRRRQIDGLRKRVRRAVTLGIRIPVVILFVVLFFGGLTVAYASFTSDTKTFPIWIVGLVMALLGVAALVPQFFPGSVLEWVRPLEKRLFVRNVRAGAERLGYNLDEEDLIWPNKTSQG